jgi:hypothetical protein
MIQTFLTGLTGCLLLIASVFFFSFYNDWKRVKRARIEKIKRRKEEKLIIRHFSSPKEGRRPLDKGKRILNNISDTQKEEVNYSLFI